MWGVFIDVSVHHLFNCFSNRGNDYSSRQSMLTWKPCTLQLLTKRGCAKLGLCLSLLCSIRILLLLDKHADAVTFEEQPGHFDVETASVHYGFLGECRRVYALQYVPHSSTKKQRVVIELESLRIFSFWDGNWWKYLGDAWVDLNEDVTVASNGRLEVRQQSPFLPGNVVVS